MAPPRRQTKPVKALNVQIIDFSATEEETIECELPVDPQLHTQSTTESQPESQPDPHTPSLSDQSSRIKWTPLMLQTLFTELLDQALDGKRADNGFKKEAWDSVLEEVQKVHTGSYLITIDKIKAQEQTYKAYYKDWKFLREQSGFGWDEETRMVTASEEVWNNIIIVGYYYYKRANKLILYSTTEVVDGTKTTLFLTPIYFKSYTIPQ
jgi:Myb/SANT-like DNA-binding domain